MTDKTILIILAILCSLTIVALLTLFGGAIYFTWIYDPDISTEIADRDLAIITKLYITVQRAELREIHPITAHLDSLVDRGAVK